MRSPIAKRCWDYCWCCCWKPIHWLVRHLWSDFYFVCRFNSSRKTKKKKTTSSWSFLGAIISFVGCLNAWDSRDSYDIQFPIANKKIQQQLSKKIENTFSNNITLSQIAMFLLLCDTRQPRFCCCCCCCYTFAGPTKSKKKKTNCRRKTTDGKRTMQTRKEKYNGRFERRNLFSPMFNGERMEKEKICRKIDDWSTIRYNTIQ